MRARGLNSSADHAQCTFYLQFLPAENLQSAVQLPNPNETVASPLTRQQSQQPGLFSNEK